MSPFAIAINDYVAQIKTPAEATPVRQASLKEFNAAVEGFIAGGETFRADDDFTALTGAGADWNDTTTRGALWANVAQIEDDYRNTKIDGREG